MNSSNEQTPRVPSDILLYTAFFVRVCSLNLLLSPPKHSSSSSNVFFSGVCHLVWEWNCALCLLFAWLPFANVLWLWLILYLESSAICFICMSIALVLINFISPYFQNAVPEDHKKVYSFFEIPNTFIRLHCTISSPFVSGFHSTKKSHLLMNAVVLVPKWIAFFFGFVCTFAFAFVVAVVSGLLFAFALIHDVEISPHPCKHPQGLILPRKSMTSFKEG